MGRNAPAGWRPDQRTYPHNRRRAGPLPLLTISFLMLQAFAAILLSPEHHGPPQPAIIVGATASLGAVSVLIVVAVLRPESAGLISLADVLTRYLLGIPGAPLGPGH